MEEKLNEGAQPQQAAQVVMEKRGFFGFFKKPAVKNVGLVLIGVGITLFATDCKGVRTKTWDATKKGFGSVKDRFSAKDTCDSIDNEMSQQEQPVSQQANPTSFRGNDGGQQRFTGNEERRGGYNNYRRDFSRNSN